MQAFNSRVATDEDVNAVVALVNSAYRGDSSRKGWTTEADLLGGQRTDPESLKQTLHREGSVVLLLERDGELVACVNLEKQDGHAAYLGMLTVRPDQQGAGTGKALLHLAEQWARREWGTKRMEMTVIVQREELIAWYERRGYRRTGNYEPFPYGDERFGLPKRPDLKFEILEKSL